MLHVVGRFRGRQQFQASRAFTLIEVLVVVAIIALLISILLPSLAKAREQAKSVACKGNLHDLGISFTVYTETYKGYFPLAPAGDFDTYWSLYKANLLKNRKVLLCPSTANVVREQTLQYPAVLKTSAENSSIKVPVGSGMDGKGSDIDKVAAEGKKDSAGGHSYEYNGVFNNNSDKDPRPFKTAKRHKRTTFVKLRFHNLVLVHDADNHQKWFGTLGCTNSLDLGNNCPQTIDNHGAEGLNTMFGDGHADWVKKLPGRFVDYRRMTPEVKDYDQNASIDRLWLQSQCPPEYAETTAGMTY